MTKQKNVTDPYYYVAKYERITTKLWRLQDKTEDPIKFQRYLKNALKAHKALLKYVKPTLYGYKLR